MNKETKLSIVVEAKNKAEKTLGDIKGSLDGIQKSNEGLIATSKQVGAIAGVAFVGLASAIGYTIKSASEAQVAMAKVDATLKAMGRSTDGTKEKILELAQASLKLGFDDEEASLSITKFYQATNDLAKATEYNNLAMDIARAKSISLTDANRAVSLMLAGNLRAVKEYGIGIDETLTPLQAITEAQRIFSGQATEASKTLAVQTQVLKETFGNLSESIGTTFIPLVTQMIQAITPVIEKITAWVEQNPELAKTLLLVALGVTGLVAGMALLLPIVIAIATPIGLMTLGLVAFLVVLGFTVVQVYKLASQWGDVWTLMQIAVADWATAVASVFEVVINGIIAGINVVLKAINSTINALSKVPVIGSKFKNAKVSMLEEVKFDGFNTDALYGKLSGGGHGGTVINISNNTLLDENVAEKMGDLIMKKLGMSNAF